MPNDVFTFLVGGKAGEGVKKAAAVASSVFAGMGRGVFEMNDYQSLIRGGHNFSVVSTTPRNITSHYLKADLVVALDKRSCELHKDHLADGGVLVYNSDVMGDGHGNGIGLPLTAHARKYPNPGLRVGVGAVAVLGAAIGLSGEQLKTIIQEEYPADIENNIAYAGSIYELAAQKFAGRFTLAAGTERGTLLSGNEAIAAGAAAGGLDIYIGYPMTPASTILHYLAAHQKDLGIAVVHPENEIAVANIAIGATVAGAQAMVGSSGGGVALMGEAFSLAGMAEAPLLVVFSSRPGPATGVPTYTEQADLRFALSQGHGEFPRIVASPGSIEEAFYLAAEMLSMVWHFQTPGVLLTEKHLSESRMTVSIDATKASWPAPLMHGTGEYKRYRDTKNGISPLLFPPSRELINWNSYEHDEMGITTEQADMIVRMHDKRNKKENSIVQHMKGMRTVNVYGDGKPVIVTYGSTTMSVLEALQSGNSKATVVQPVYLEPLPVWELERFRNSDAIIVEQSSTGQFAALLKEKAGIESKAVIKQYDGRPFEPVELAEKIAVAC